jgi:hypothetical protein
MKMLALVLAFVGVGALAFGRQAPPDTKGWHGAEWGMTKDQVDAATGFQLGDAVLKKSDQASPAGEPMMECRSGGPTNIGAVPVVSTFCFSTTGQHGLFQVLLEVQVTTAFDDLRAELKARYGEPTAKDDYSGQRFGARQAKWLLPSTAISLNWASIPPLPDHLFLVYSRRTAPVL